MPNNKPYWVVVLMELKKKSNRSHTQRQLRIASGINSVSGANLDIRLTRTDLKKSAGVPRSIEHFFRSQGVKILFGFDARNGSYSGRDLQVADCLTYRATLSGRHLGGHLRKTDAPAFVKDVRMRPNARAKLIIILTDTNACQIGKPNTNDVTVFVRAIKNSFESIRILYTSLFAPLSLRKHASGLVTRSWVRLILCLLLFKKNVSRRQIES